MTTRINVPMWDKMQFFCKRIADHQIRLVLHFKGDSERETIKRRNYNDS